MLDSYTSENQQQWERSRIERQDKHAKATWLGRWAAFLTIRHYLDDLDLPYEEASRWEKHSDDFVEAFEQTLPDQDGVQGFLVAVDHPDRRVRVEAAFGIAAMWDTDNALAQAAFARLSHDDDPDVRSYTIEQGMIMLTGYGIESDGIRANLDEPGSRALQGLLDTAMADIEAAGLKGMLKL